MNLHPHHDLEHRDEIAAGPLAVIGSLIGAVLALAGLLGRHPTFGSMFRLYEAKPSLSPEETFWLGVALIAASVAGYLWRPGSHLRRPR